MLFHLKNYPFRYTLILIALISCFSFVMEPHAVYGQDEEGEKLIVATKVIEPFVIKDGDRFTGFSVDLMKEISLITELPFEVVEVETVTEQLDMVINGQADLAIAAISMTVEREELVDFSYPYFTSGLQIMATGKPVSTFSRLLSFLTSSRFFVGVLALMGIMIIIGHIIWLVERGKNPDFPHSYLAGVWEGVWWTAVTLTTVGYGDKRVKDKLGRLIAIFWMFAGLFLIANFTAFVTAEITVNTLTSTINDLDDLPGKRVVTVEGTTSAEFLRKRGIRYRSVSHIDDAYAILEEGLADALVYDAPVLQYYLASNNANEFQLVGSPFKPEDYGIALQTDSPYEEIINTALLEINSNGTFEELINRWSIAE